MKIKTQLSQCARELAQEVLVEGSSGNISAKSGKTIYIKKSNTSFKSAKPEDFICISQKSAISVEWKLHKACYDARPDIKAVVHTHPLAILTLASLKIKIKPASVDYVIYFKKGIKVVRFAPPASKKLAQTTACAIKECNGVILSNHGFVTVGESLEQAVLRNIVAEREAKLILAAFILKQKPRYLTLSQIKKIYKI